MPEITVLIPTYNCGKFIQHAIESVLKQSYTDYEILVIDDGSTDNTECVVKGMGDARILYYKNEQNIGISASSNKGILLAKGKYIARMDADDVMIGNRLGDQVDFLEKNLDYGMVGGWYKMTDEKGFVFRDIETITDDSDLRIAIIFRNQFAQPTVTMRTSLAKSLLYDENLPSGEDYDLWMRFARISKIANLPNYYLLYRWHSNSTCNRDQRGLKLSMILVLSRELNRLKIDHNERELMLHTSVGFGMAYSLLQSKEKKEELAKWHDKIFSSSELIKIYKKKRLNVFREKFFQNNIIKTLKEIPDPLNRDLYLNKNNRSFDKQNRGKLAKITVITVVLNMVETIERCIVSVVTQNYLNVEYIIIDGGSTDGTIEIIQQYRDKLSYFVSEADNGIADAFNKGLRQSTGDAIGIINADDWYEPNAIKSIANEYKKHNYCHVFYGKCNFLLPNHEIICNTKANNHVFLIQGMSIAHPSVFVTREAYLLFGIFNPEYKIALDYDLLLRFLCQGAIFRFIDNILSNHSYGGVSQRHRAIADVESNYIKQRIFKEVFS